MLQYCSGFCTDKQYLHFAIINNNNLNYTWTEEDSGNRITVDIHDAHRHTDVYAFAMVSFFLFCNLMWHNTVCRTHITACLVVFCSAGKYTSCTVIKWSRLSLACHRLNWTCCVGTLTFCSGSHRSAISILRLSMWQRACLFFKICFAFLQHFVSSAVQ